MNRPRTGVTASTASRNTTIWSQPLAVMSELLRSCPLLHQSIAQRHVTNADGEEQQRYADEHNIEHDTPPSVRETNAHGANHPRAIVAVERLRRVAERLVLDAAVQIPRAEARRARDRHGSDRAHA